MQWLKQINPSLGFQPAATMVGSQFLRALCYRASLGSKYFLIQLGETSMRNRNPGFRDHGNLVVKPFLHMTGKGILPISQNPEAMLSLSPVAVGMKTPEPGFLSASHNSHHIAAYESDPMRVFSRLERFWGQAPTPEYDFGYSAVGREKLDVRNNKLTVTVPMGTLRVKEWDYNSSGEA